MKATRYVRCTIAFILAIPAGAAMTIGLFSLVVGVSQALLGNCPEAMRALLASAGSAGSLMICYWSVKQLLMSDTEICSA